MDYKHTSVLFEQCIEYLDIKEGGVYIDGTVGGGGHAEGICKKLGEGGILIGIDRDDDALKATGKRLEKYCCRKIYIKRNYADIKTVMNELKIGRADGAVLDLGVSSYQLDNPERGFSYMTGAPLDMRMDAASGFSAYDVVNTYTQEELTAIIRKYGEERWASRIAGFIVKARSTKPVENTDELVDIIKAAIPASARREGPHPAKRTFQAIRIEVNDEISGLEEAVSSFCDVLSEGGRLCVISFHSLEDRIVKNEFKSRVDMQRITKKPVTPEQEELSQNPRARSAKLRVVEKRRTQDDDGRKMV